MEHDAVPAELAAALLAAGYRVGGPAGVGGGGPVWTATRVDDDPVGPARGSGGRDRADAPDTTRVVVHVVPAPGDPDGGGLAARLRALAALDHPHLARLVGVLEVPPSPAGGPRRWAVLCAEVPGATVAALLAARGRLTAGEVVTLVVPVAGALDALHRAGLVHGDVSPANVVVRPDGRPVLIDLLGGTDAGGEGTGRGTPGFVAPEVLGGGGRRAAPEPAPDGLPPGAPADVFSLGCVALAALDLGAVGSRLGQELTAACAPDPVRRPTAAEVATACYPCASPEPITLPDAGVLARTALAQLASGARTVSTPARSRHRASGARRGRAPRHRALMALALVGAAAVAAAVALGPPARDARVPPIPVAAASPGWGAATAGPDVSTDAGRFPDPVTAAVELTRRRAEVLASGEVAALTEVSRPGSGAHAADVALMADLRATGVRLEGLVAVVEDAHRVAVPTSAESVPRAPMPAAPTPAAAPAGAATHDAAGVPSSTLAHVSVRSGLGAHRRVSGDGAVDVPARPPRDVVLRLVLTDGGWRVEDVLDG